MVGAEAVPVGKYSREAIQNLAGLDGYPAGYAESVLGNVVSQEENVKAVVAKVQLGEADAGFVYRSDVSAPVARYVERARAARRRQRARELSDRGAGRRRRTPKAARAFVDLVTGPEGQRVLAKHGLMPAGATP